MSTLLTYLCTELSPSWETANCAATQETPSNFKEPEGSSPSSQEPSIGPMSTLSARNIFVYQRVRELQTQLRTRILETQAIRSLVFTTQWLSQFQMKGPAISLDPFTVV
jgi:hypothetical protein